MRASRCVTNDVYVNDFYIANVFVRVNCANTSTLAVGRARQIRRSKADRLEHIGQGKVRYEMSRVGRRQMGKPHFLSVLCKMFLGRQLLRHRGPVVDSAGFHLPLTTCGHDVRHSGCTHDVLRELLIPSSRSASRTHIVQVIQQCRGATFAIHSSQGLLVDAILAKMSMLCWIPSRSTWLTLRMHLVSFWQIDVHGK